MDKLVLVGSSEHNFTYVDEAGQAHDVRVNKGQDILPLGLPDNVVESLRGKYRGRPDRPIMYYLPVKEGEAVYQNGSAMIQSGTPNVEKRPEPKPAEIDPDDPGAELARELAEEDRRAEEEARTAATNNTNGENDMENEHLQADINNVAGNAPVDAAASGDDRAAELSVISAAEQLAAAEKAKEDGEGDGVEAAEPAPLDEQVAALKEASDAKAERVATEPAERGGEDEVVEAQTDLAEATGTTPPVEVEKPATKKAAAPKKAAAKKDKK